MPLGAQLSHLENYTEKNQKIIDMKGCLKFRNYNNIYDLSHHKYIKGFAFKVLA